MQKDELTFSDNNYICLKHLNKIYDNHVQAVFDFNLDIKKNEFIVFVGPSGCGKSTTLRMIAGLEDISSGDLFIDGELCNQKSPNDRNISMVFQSYALFPHLSVYDNIAFGLKIRKIAFPVYDKNGNPVLAIDKKKIKENKNRIAQLQGELKDANEEDISPIERNIQILKDEIQYLSTTPTQKYVYKNMPKKEIEKKVLEAAEILEITDYLKRKPRELSGGQRQRVALGRSIVRNAKAFLMDEPLSNLDAKLRVQMRSEIVRLHEKLNATTIYVTHDQVEAMTMADRIVVMKDGYIQQIGTPVEIYNTPANQFVAGFIGSPSMNFIVGSYEKGEISFGEDGKVLLSKEDAKIHDSFYNSLLEAKEQELNALMIEIDASSDKRGHDHKSNLLKEKANLLEADINSIKEYISSAHPIIIGIRPEDVRKSTNGFVIEVSAAELLGKEYYVHSDCFRQNSNNDFVIKMPVNEGVKTGDKIELEFNLNKIHFFDPISSKNILNK